MATFKGEYVDNIPHTYIIANNGIKEIRNIHYGKKRTVCAGKWCNRVMRYVNAFEASMIRK